jgi:hypothetical protein
VSSGTIGTTGASFIQGYTTTRSLGNTDARPTIQLNVASATVSVATGVTFIGVIFDGNSQTASRLSNATSSFFRCHFKNFNTATGNVQTFVYSTATGNSATIFVGVMCIFCEAYGNTATGISTGVAIFSVSSGNTGATSEGFVPGTVCYRCTAVANGQDGFQHSINTPGFVIDSHAESNVRDGYFTGNQGLILVNDSYYGNGTSGIAVSTPFANIGPIPVTAGSVFNNAGAFDFSLNSTGSQGALLLNTAFPALFPRGLTATYQDVGAAQHQASVGGQTGGVN